MRNYCKLTAALFGLFLQSACGIDRGGIDQEDPIGAPIVTTSFPGAAIVGKLSAVDANAGNIMIGVDEFTISETDIIVNGVAATAADLVPGMFGVATRLPEGSTGLPTKLMVDFNVASGQIQASDFPNSVTLLGQTVLTATLMPISPFADSLTPGVAGIAFSGYERSNGEVVATAVLDYPPDAPALVTGTIRTIDTVSRQFSIGQQTIDYSQVQNLITSTGTVADGMRVRIQVEPGTLGQSINAISITEVPLVDSSLLAGASISISGFATTPVNDVISVANQNIVVNAATVFESVELTSSTSPSLVTVSARLQDDGTVLALSVAPAE